MTDEERKQRVADIQAAVSSPGGRIIFDHIAEEMRDGWENFIKLPVAQKTGKAAYNAQARYEVLKGLIDWVDSEVRLSEIS